MRLPAQPVEQDTISPLKLFGLVLPTNRCSVSAIHCPERYIPALSTGDDLVAVRRRIERAVADGAPEQLKRLLDTVVDQILVESRACIQPYFVAPTVRTRIGSRRRTGIEPA